MTIRTVAQRFVKLCSEGKNFEVMHTMYSPDIVSVEGGGQEFAGQPLVIKKSEDWAAVNTIDAQTVHGPYFSGPTAGDGQFAIHFVHVVTPKATGKQVTLDEVGLYTVTGDKITREQFFYEGSR